MIGPLETAPPPGMNWPPGLPADHLEVLPATSSAQTAPGGSGSRSSRSASIGGDDPRSNTIARVDQEIALLRARWAREDAEEQERRRRMQLASEAEDKMDTNTTTNLNDADVIAIDLSDHDAVFSDVEADGSSSAADGATCLNEGAAGAEGSLGTGTGGPDGAAAGTTCPRKGEVGAEGPPNPTLILEKKKNPFPPPAVTERPDEAVEGLLGSLNRGLGAGGSQQGNEPDSGSGPSQGAVKGAEGADGSGKNEAAWETVNRHRQVKVKEKPTKAELKAQRVAEQQEVYRVLLAAGGAADRWDITPCTEILRNNEAACVKAPV